MTTRARPNKKRILKRACIPLFSFLIIIYLQSSLHHAFGFNGDDPPNIILFSLDGFQRNHLLELLRNGSLPNLKGLIDNGVFLNLTICDYLTQTKPGHSQMLTGYRGKYSGVYSNTVYFHPVPDGYSLLERVEVFFGSENVVTCMITGKKKNIEVDWVATSGESEYCERGILSNIPENIDVTLVSQNPSYIVGMRMIEFIEKYSTEHFVAFFHLQEPDVQGHAFGENSKEYDWGAMSCDYWLGRILNKLEETDTADNTLIYVLTDHGFNENDFQHKSDPNVWMATNDLRLSVNEDESWCDMIDVAPTVFYSLGMDLSSFTPRLEGYPLQEKLPSEANERIGLYNDTRSPITQFDLKMEGIKISPHESMEIRFTISDDKPMIGYLLLNNTLLEVYRQEEKLPIFQNYLFELNVEYNLNASNHVPGKYILKMVAFDDKENLSKTELSIFILSEPKTQLEKITYFIMKNTLPLLIISLMILLITIIIIIILLRAPD